MPSSLCLSLWPFPPFPILPLAVSRHSLDHSMLSLLNFSNLTCLCLVPCAPAPTPLPTCNALLAWQSAWPSSSSFVWDVDSWKNYLQITCVAYAPVPPSACLLNVLCAGLRAHVLLRPGSKAGRQATAAVAAAGISIMSRGRIVNCFS